MDKRLNLVCLGQESGIAESGATLCKTTAGSFLHNKAIYAPSARLKGDVWRPLCRASTVTPAS